MPPSFQALAGAVVMGLLGNAGKASRIALCRQMYQKVRATDPAKHRKDSVDLLRFHVYQTMCFDTVIQGR